MSDVTIQMTGGGSPERFLSRLERAATPNTGDAVFLCQVQRTRILERTARGVDVDGNPFAPYNTKRPYIYYPAAWSKVAKTKKAAGRRFAKKIGAGTVTASGGVRFPSYAAFKSSLGRTNPDLRGARAPHMLQAIIVKSRTGSEGSLGIYGEEAARAAGHNEGTRGLPRRRFFDASPVDAQVLAEAEKQRLLTRMEKVVG